MFKAPILCCAAAAAILLASGSADACGDKLSVIGGGVSFDRVSRDQYHGNVVMLLAPNSALRAANDELKLRQALEYAGNKVRTVETAADLASIVAKGNVDVVLVSWSDAAKLRDELAGGSGAPFLLPVAYGVDNKELTAASQKGVCYTLARDKQLVKAVSRVMEQREKDLPVECGTVATAAN